ncbi:MAG TPA: hypothetical protein VNV38_12235 [Stellaceae bacterium]|nr:hypothetical protein [Stellaceae bacterium]
MRCLVAILIGFPLLAALPAAAQDADPFHEVAPPAAPTPGQDPFQMAPADPAPAPAPAQKPAPPRPHREPDPQPVAAPAAPPPPPPPTPPPTPNAKCFVFNNKQFCE